MHYDYSSPEAVPAFDPCPRVCIWSHRADRGSIPPRWGDDPGSRAGPARGFAAVRGVGRLCLSGRLRTAQEASKRGMGAEPPCKPRPCSQEAACSRLMAVTQRRRPPRLADLPHDQRQRPGGEAPSSTAPHDGRRPDRRGPRKYRPHASHAPGTSTPTGARQGPPARAGPPRRAPVGVEGGRARQSESPSTDAGFVQSRIPLSFACITCCIRDKPRPLRGLFAR